MDLWLLFKALAALLLIIAIILLLAKVGQATFRERFHLYSQSRQVKITERFTLDAKRSLIRFQDDQHTYLILLGQQGEHVLHKEMLGSERAHDSSL